MAFFIISRQISRKFRSYEIFRRETFYSLMSPSPNFPGNFGIGNILKFFVVFCAPKFFGHFGMRNVSSRDYTRRQISRKFWKGAFHQISGKIRSYEIFRQIWNRSSGAVFRNSQKILGSKISWKFWGREYLIIDRYISFLQIFSGNFGTGNASSRDYTKRQFSSKFWNGLSKFLGNLIDAKFTDEFGTGALGLYSKILRKFWGGGILILIFEARTKYGILRYVGLTT